MQRFVLLVLLLAAFTSGYSQVSFSADTNYVAASYPADAPVFYPWIELTNNTGALLEMRCVRLLDQKPTGWDTWLEDLDSLYRGIPDTTTFFMPAINEQAQYIIVSFFPNSIEGRSTVKLKLFPANNPADSAVLTFQGNAHTPAPNAIGELNGWLSDVQVYPQPTKGDVMITSTQLPELSSLEMVNALGQQVSVNWVLEVNAIRIATECLPAGVYYISIRNQEGGVVVRRIVKD